MNQLWTTPKLADELFVLIYTSIISKLSKNSHLNGCWFCAVDFNRIIDLPFGCVFKVIASSCFISFSSTFLSSFQESKQNTCSYSNSNLHPNFASLKPEKESFSFVFVSVESTKKEGKRKIIRWKTNRQKLLKKVFLPFIKNIFDKILAKFSTSSKKDEIWNWKNQIFGRKTKGKIKKSWFLKFSKIVWDIHKSLSAKPEFYNRGIFKLQKSSIVLVKNFRKTRSLREGKNI